MLNKLLVRALSLALLKVARDTFAVFKLIKGIHKDRSLSLHTYKPVILAVDQYGADVNSILKVALRLELKRYAHIFSVGKAEIPDLQFSLILRRLLHLQLYSLGSFLCKTMILELCNLFRHDVNLVRQRI